MEMKLKAVTQKVNTHELKKGDWVDTDGCLFRITDVTVHTSPADVLYDPKGTVVCKTMLIAREPNALLPQKWAEDWTIQGNSNATWRKVLNKKEIIADIREAMNG